MLGLLFEFTSNFLSCLDHYFPPPLPNNDDTILCFVQAAQNQLRNFGGAKEDLSALATSRGVEACRYPTLITTGHPRWTSTPVETFCYNATKVPVLSLLLLAWPVPVLKALREPLSAAAILPTNHGTDEPVH